MVLRSLLGLAGIMLLSILVIVPARAADDEREKFTISGIVWIDENRDGIRQPSEPVLPGVRVETGRSLMGLGGRSIDQSYTTNEQGQYAFTTYTYTGNGKPLRFLYLNVHYKKPGAEPVYDNRAYPYTHYGCRLLYILKEEEDRIVDIGVSQHGPASPKNRPVADGRFFRETSVHHCDAGFSVTNADGIPFWDTWHELGLENVGYPISHRYLWRGFVTQAFQKAIFQWQPGKGVLFLNIFDELHRAGKDGALRKRWALPKQLSPPFASYLPVDKWEELREDLREELREEIRRRRLALLDVNPAIKERYFASPDPLLQYGLPTSRLEDMGDHYAIRTQGAVFQQWKEDVPWARAGEVTIANGGDIASELGRICENTPYGHYRCAYLFFPGEALEIHGPEALIPQPVDFVGARPP